MTPPPSPSKTPQLKISFREGGPKSYKGSRFTWRLTLCMGAYQEPFQSPKSFKAEHSWLNSCWFSCRAMSRHQEFFSNYFKTTLGLHQKYFSTTSGLLEDFFDPTSRLFQEYFQVSLRKLQDWLWTTLRLLKLLQDYFNDNLRILLEYFNTISRLFQHTSRLILDYLKTISRLFQKYFKTTSTLL